MTFGELRLCIRWSRRDARYKLRGAALELGAVHAVRSWRIDEAERIGSPALVAHVRLWEPE